MASSDTAKRIGASKEEGARRATRSKQPAQVSVDAAFDLGGGKVDVLSDEERKIDAFRGATHDFFNPRSIDELIKEQGVKPIKDFDKLSFFEEGDDVEEMVEWIYTNCRSASPR